MSDINVTISIRPVTLRDSNSYYYEATLQQGNHYVIRDQYIGTVGEPTDDGFFGYGTLPPDDYSKKAGFSEDAYVPRGIKAINGPVDYQSLALQQQQQLQPNTFLPPQPITPLFPTTGQKQNGLQKGLQEAYNTSAMVQFAFGAGKAATIDVYRTIAGLVKVVQKATGGDNDRNNGQWSGVSQAISTARYSNIDGDLENAFRYAKEYLPELKRQLLGRIAMMEAGTTIVIGDQQSFSVPRPRGIGTYNVFIDIPDELQTLQQRIIYLKDIVNYLGVALEPLPRR